MDLTPLQFRFGSAKRGNCFSIALPTLAFTQPPQQRHRPADRARFAPQTCSGMRIRRALEAQEREDDVGQGEECECQSRQLAEETPLRDTSRNGLGLLVAPLKTRQSQPINYRSSHHLASRKVSRRRHRKTDANAPKVYLLDDFSALCSFRFAIRKALRATREK